ncbi:mCG145174, partial [Mus musculus]
TPMHLPSTLQTQLPSQTTRLKRLAGLDCIPHRGGATRTVKTSQFVSQSLPFPPVSNPRPPPPDSVSPLLLLPTRGCSLRPPSQPSLFSETSCPESASVTTTADIPRFT